jgi:16S rRNA (guanine966-N2)-methyltransferase
MRIVAGEAKGTRLAPVPAGTRPMADRAREGLFSSLGDSVEGARVLDLFAGTGALGIEALSRGAGSALFVDSAPAAVRVVRENLRRTKLLSRAEVRRGEALRTIRQDPGEFDLILVDPPYRVPAHMLDQVVQELVRHAVPAPGARVAMTRPKQGYIPVIPVNWLVERRLPYGDMVALVFRIP